MYSNLIRKIKAKLFGKTKLMQRMLYEKRNLFVPSKLFNHKHPILINSVPKSGTNMIKNIIYSVPRTTPKGDLSMAATIADKTERFEYVKERITDKTPGAVYVGHIPYSKIFADWLKENNFKHIFIYRDPRDYAVSLYHYIMRNPTPRHAYYEMMNNQRNDHDRLMSSITGIGEGRKVYRLSPESLPNVKLVFDSYIDWLKDDVTFATKYEDFVGVNMRQEEILEKIKGILNYLEFNKADEINYSSKILKNGMDPKKSHTYRKGKAGTWKEEFTDEHIEAFKDVSGDLLTKLHYSW